MSSQRTGGTQRRGDRVLLRVRLARGVRLALSFASALTEAEIDERTKAIVEVAQRLVASGRPHDVKPFAAQIAAAKGPRELRIILLAASKLAASTAPLLDQGDTFGAFADRWTNGTLTKQFPDHVKKKKTSGGDAGRLSKHILPHVRTIPLKLFRLEHAQSVMESLPSELSGASRRHVAQLMYRLMRMAVYPARLIDVSPLPPGFLPRLGAKKAKAYLYPSEDAALIGCAKVPAERRVLYAFLAREGMRLQEALDLEWSAIDLARGLVTLDSNKTDDPRSWVMGDDVRRALEVWKKASPVKPFPVPVRHLADTLREDLATAGVKRAELFTSSDTRRAIRAHDLRATFVTLALAAGKGETWVADRTGHKSSTQIATYRRASRTAAELGLGWLAPMDVALQGGIKVGSETTSAKPRTIAKTPKKRER